MLSGECGTFGGEDEDHSEEGSYFEVWGNFHCSFVETNIVKYAAGNLKLDAYHKKQNNVMLIHKAQTVVNVTLYSVCIFQK